MNCKTIRVLEPYGGWGYHHDFYTDTIDENFRSTDTGLCNRLFNWELYCDIIYRCQPNNIQLAVQRWIWPEV